MFNVLNIVHKLNKDNNIFANNGVYLKDLQEFTNNGISDYNDNYFYIRPLNLNERKYSIKNNNELSEITINYRAVFHFKSIDTLKAMRSLVGQIINCDTNITVNYISDDNKGIYYAEYRKDKEVRGNLISIDFKVVEEVYFANCECLNDLVCK